jgi:predicted CxxxxCH...CXXCH cytochrome family protein
MAGLCARALDAGIEQDYVRGLVKKRGLVPESPPVEAEAWPWTIKILTLGRFEVLLDGEPVRFARKVQRKPLALLKALIAFGGRGVREELVMDALWPDAEGDAARVALASALHRLRGLLGRGQAILRQEAAEPGQPALLGRRLGRGAPARTCRDRSRPGLAASRRPYRGAFLDERESAAGDRHGRASVVACSATSCASGGSASRANPQEAVDWYEEALRVDPCAEDACQTS